MSVARFAKPAVVVAAALLVAGCGGGSGTHSRQGTPSKTQPDSTTSQQPAEPPAGLGRGASFAPRGSVLYVSTTSDPSAWAALSHVRSRIPFGDSWNETTPGNLIAELLSGHPFDISTSPIAHALTGSSSETLVSYRGAKGLHVGLLPDVIFYSGVRDAGFLQNWLKKSSQRIGSDGPFTLYRAKKPGIGYHAVSKSGWLFAYSLPSLRRAIASGSGQEPSLAHDPAVRSALAAVDTRDAALVGYTRGDLLQELTATHENLKESGDGTDTTELTPGFGLADTAFAIGANASGFWLDSAPRTSMSGYRPGPTFTPTLLGEIPQNELLYVGIKNGSGQWARIDNSFHTYAKAAFGSSNENSGRFIESLVSLYFRIRPSDITNLGDGEQAWYFGDTVGAAIRPANLSQALSAAQAMTRRTFPDSGVATGRDGDVVWLRNTRLANQATIPGPAPSALVLRAHLKYPISLVIAADLSPLTSALVDGSQPDGALDGVVMATAPGTDGRYQLDAYIDVRS